MKPDVLRQAIGAASGVLKNRVLQVQRSGEMERYAKDPIAWAVERFGIPIYTILWSLSPGFPSDHHWDGTPDPIGQVARNLAEGKHTGVQSATGTGKTFLAAWLTYWFLDTHERSQVILLAPREKQLKINAWKEISRMFPRFQQIRPNAELLDLELRVDTSDKRFAGWGAIATGAQVKAGEASATALQGIHDGWVLFILEECPGIHPAILEAVAQTISDPARNLRLALGNPDHAQDALNQFCNKAGVERITISALDHPNVVLDERVIAGAVMRESVENRKKDLGGETNPLYLSRVRGICPSESEASLIKLEWCYRARDRWRARREAEEAGHPLPLPGIRAIGVDVANSRGGDQASIARGRGPVVEDLEAFPCEDSNVLGHKLAIEIRSDGVSPERVGVDGQGVGAGCVNKLREEGFEVQNLNRQSTVDDEDEIVHYNFRAQMWWWLRESLRRDEIEIPDDDELFADLTSCTWTLRGGKVLVESKDEIKARLGRSPNKGDSCVYWNAVRIPRERPRPPKRIIPASQSYVCV
jgi:phage terminase large subunit